MSIAGYIFWALAISLLLYVVVIYNGLVRLKHAVVQAWSNIDVLLKQRHDELPKLIDSCRQYMQHEKELLERIAQARASVFKAGETGDVRALAGAETRLRAGLGQLFAVAENYPELRASESFRHLQNRISQLELQIADRREFYNDCVNANNVRIEQFPDVLVARMLNFAPRTLLKFDEQELKDVNVRASFNS